MAGLLVIDPFTGLQTVVGGTSTLATSSVTLKLLRKYSSSKPLHRPNRNRSNMATSSMVESKAQAVVNNMTANAGGTILAGLLPIIIQIIGSLLGGGGMGLCPKPTTGAAVKARLIPTRRNRRIARRTVEQYIDNPTTAALAEDSLFNVCGSMTDDEAMTLYAECNP